MAPLLHRAAIIKNVRRTYDRPLLRIERAIKRGGKRAKERTAINSRDPGKRGPFLCVVYVRVCFRRTSEQVKLRLKPPHEKNNFAATPVAENTLARRSFKRKMSL